MLPFDYFQARDEQAAISAHDLRSSYVAGGTCLLDLMKLHVQTPARLIDINDLPLARIEPHGDGVRVGSMARNSDAAYHPLIRDRYPVLSQALLAGASPQLRNMATVGGNIMQRTRCPYFRDTAFPCNKRQPGSGCSAMDGYNRMHAILGGSSHCIAVMPSDMCVALAALEATVQVRGPHGERAVPFVDFHLEPGDHPERETVLAPGELITAVDLPAIPFATRSRYLKVRDRAQYAFALVSVAVALDLQNGVIRNARIAMGGVGTKPWRAFEAEKSLVGKLPSQASFRAAADMALRGAKPRKYNAFKVEMARRAIVRTLNAVGAMS